MAYCSLTDLKKVEPEAQLIQLTDDAGSGLIDETNLAGAISGADSLINTYLRGHAELPLDPVPDIIVQISAELAICNLYKRRFGSSMPETMKDRQKWAEGKLLQIVNGQIKISEEQQAAASEAHAVIRTPEKEFPSTVLDQF